MTIKDLWRGFWDGTEQRPPLSAAERKREARRATKKRYQREWLAKRVKKFRPKPNPARKRKLIGRECADCLFRAGYGSHFISKRVPLSSSTLLEIKPKGAVTRKPKPPKPFDTANNFGKECAVCLLGFGFGLKSIQAMLPVTRRRARRWRAELGLQHATRDPNRLRRIGKTGAYYKSVESRLADAIRGRMNAAIARGQKSASSIKLLGCSIPEARLHLEKQFKRGMSWDNYGDWHIDHITPCAAFDLSRSYHQRLCFHFSNLQPLWALENISKNDRILKHQAHLALSI